MKKVVVADPFDTVLTEFRTKMQNAVSALLREFSGIRTNRASPKLLDSVHVEAYGNQIPLQQAGTISAPDARTLMVQVWDKSMVKSVEKAIRESDLGLNPAVEGQIIRIPMPMLSEERRKELTKVASRFAEEAKVSVRNVRRDAIDLFKKQEKSHEITEDDLRQLTDQIQKMTDKRIKEIEDSLESKQKDILTV